jgi:hypothetical protein
MVEIGVEIAIEEAGGRLVAHRTAATRLLQIE